MQLPGFLRRFALISPVQLSWLSQVIYPPELAILDAEGIVVPFWMVLLDGGTPVFLFEFARPDYSRTRLIVAEEFLRSISSLGLRVALLSSISHG